MCSEWISKSHKQQQHTGCQKLYRLLWIDLNISSLETSKTICLSQKELKELTNQRKKNFVECLVFLLCTIVSYVGLKDGSALEWGSVERL